MREDRERNEGILEKLKTELSILTKVSFHKKQVALPF
jgi:hypothetical protein